MKVTRHFQTRANGRQITLNTEGDQLKLYLGKRGQDHMTQVFLLVDHTVPVYHSRTPVDPTMIGESGGMVQLKQVLRAVYGWPEKRKPPQQEVDQATKICKAVAKQWERKFNSEPAPPKEEQAQQIQKMLIHLQHKGKQANE